MNKPPIKLQNEHIFSQILVSKPWRNYGELNIPPPPEPPCSWLIYLFDPPSPPPDPKNGLIIPYPPPPELPFISFNCAIKFSFAFITLSVSKVKPN